MNKDDRRERDHELSLRLTSIDRALEINKFVNMKDDKSSTEFILSEAAKIYEFLSSPEVKVETPDNTQGPDNPNTEG